MEVEYLCIHFQTNVKIVMSTSVLNNQERNSLIILFLDKKKVGVCFNVIIIYNQVLKIEI